MWSQVILNNFGSRAQNVIDTKKLSSAVVLLCAFTHIWISTPWPTKHARVCQQQDGFILHDSFFLYFQINIYQISQISTIRMKIRAQHFKRYVTTCFQIRSRIILFIFSGYVPGLYFFLFVCGNFPITLKKGSCWNTL